MSMQIAAPNKQRIIPAFTVQKLEGTVDHTIIQFDKEGKRYEKQIKVPAGYLVSFPTKGHSIRVKNMEELKRLGFDRTIPLVDDASDNDDVVGTIPNSVLSSS